MCAQLYRVAAFGQPFLPRRDATLARPAGIPERFGGLEVFHQPRHLLEGHVCQRVQLKSRFLGDVALVDGVSQLAQVSEEFANEARPELRKFFEPRTPNPNPEPRTEP